MSPVCFWRFPSDDIVPNVCLSEWNAIDHRDDTTGTFRSCKKETVSWGVGLLFYTVIREFLKNSSIVIYEWS